MCESIVRSRTSINVLGITFDSKLNWNQHISNCINKAKKSLFALRLLRKFFNQNEMRVLLDSYFYSVLYYNAVIWLMPRIGSVMTQKLLSVSACALRICLLSNNCELLLERIHEINKKCIRKKQAHPSLIRWLGG